MAKDWSTAGMDAELAKDAFEDTLFGDLEGAAELLSLMEPETLQEAIESAEDFLEALHAAVAARLNRVRRAVL